MTLQTLLNDEQKAFERQLDKIFYKVTLDEYNELKSSRALHDQKIITAVIGMIDKKHQMNEGNSEEIDGYNEAVNNILSDLQQALKKEIV